MVALCLGTGNRQRIDLNHVRADDAETLAKALADADLLLLHTRLCVAFCDFIATRHSQYAPVQWAWLAEAGTTSSEKL